MKECQKKSLLWEIEFHYKQLSCTVQEQPSTVIHFRKFIQKILVVESFFSQITDWLFRVAIIYKNGSTKDVFFEIFLKILERLNIIDCKYLR